MDKELFLLAKDILDTLEKDDKEYEFRKNRCYVERNVSAKKFIKEEIIW